MSRNFRYLVLMGGVSCCMASNDESETEKSVARTDGAVSGFEILQKLVDLPISTWRYNEEEPHVRHLGPMAQDFAATFGLGDDDTKIMIVDIGGVAFVSIQALNRKIEALEKRIDELESQR